jgi:glutaredoxin-related protein
MYFRTLVNIFAEKKIKYEYFDILQDEEVRQGNFFQVNFLDKTKNY